MTETQTRQLHTPFPLGPMPENVKMYPKGPPFGRLHLELDATHVPWVEDTRVVLDRLSGEWFRLKRTACGAGCKCAASAEWLPDYEPETPDARQ